MCKYISITNFTLGKEVYKMSLLHGFVKCLASAIWKYSYNNYGEATIKIYVLNFIKWAMLQNKTNKEYVYGLGHIFWEIMSQLYLNNANSLSCKINIEDSNVRNILSS